MSTAQTRQYPPPVPAHLATYRQFRESVLSTPGRSREEWTRQFQQSGLQLCLLNSPLYSFLQI